jgi:hypothetical protein
VRFRSQIRTGLRGEYLISTTAVPGWLGTARALGVGSSIRVATPDVASRIAVDLRNDAEAHIFMQRHTRRSNVLSCRLTISG